MIIVKKSADLKQYLQAARAKGQTIGFVPTMGALHSGHISLIGESRKRCGITLCSIFVNPTQFNNASDLQHYPRTLENDIELLEGSGCDILFLPNVEEIYPKDFIAPQYEIDYLDDILEGKFRPGHFQGVCQVVDILLQICHPNFLFLGEKDYQQCMVIKKMIEIKNHKTDVIICKTIREEGGLAMSSRNMRLSNDERQTALNIYQTLVFLRDNLKAGPMDLLLSQARVMLEKNGFAVEYVAIADANTLQPLENWDGKVSVVGLVAAFLGEIRLIDNLLLSNP